jgi:hypothetical protein
MPHGQAVFNMSGMARRMTAKELEPFRSSTSDTIREESQQQLRMLERMQATLDLILQKLEVKTQASGLIQGNEAIDEYEKILLKDRRLI